MTKKILFFTPLLILVFLTPACGKKQVRFTGRESDEQAFSKCLHLSTKKKFQQAIDCLEVFKSRFPDSRLALEAELRIADAYYQKKEYLLASETYQLYAKLHPTSDKLDYAYYRIGLCAWHETPKKIDRDQQHLPEAIDAFAIVFNQFPDSPYAKMAKVKYDDARRRVAQRHFYVGRFYYKWGEYKAAIPRFQEVYLKYPDLGLDEQALYYEAISYKKLGKKADAQATLALMESKFPNGKKTKEVKNELKD